MNAHWKKAIKRAERKDGLVMWYRFIPIAILIWVRHTRYQTPPRPPLLSSEPRAITHPLRKIPLLGIVSPSHFSPPSIFNKAGAYVNKLLAYVSTLYLSRPNTYHAHASLLWALFRVVLDRSFISLKTLRSTLLIPHSSLDVKHYPCHESSIVHTGD